MKFNSFIQSNVRDITNFSLLALQTNVLTYNHNTLKI